MNREEISKPLEGFHGFITVQSGGDAVIVSFSPVDLAAVLINHRLENIQACRYPGGGHVELVILPAQHRNHFHDFRPGLWYAQVQILKNILPVKQHLEGHLFRYAPYSTLIGSRTHETGTVFCGDIVKTAQSAQIHHSAPHGEILGRCLVQADYHIRSVARQRCSQHDIHGNQLKFHWNACFRSESFIDHVLNNLCLLPTG